METLLEHFSLEDILIFIALASLAVKGCVTFIDWAWARIKVITDAEYQSKKEKQELKIRLEEDSQIMAALKKSQKDLIEEHARQYAELTAKINMLIDSDKDSIKSYLTEKHHYFCYEKKWIDDYSLECCERQFSHYQDEGGNSYIESFMMDLRALPLCPPDQNIVQE